MCSTHNNHFFIISLIISLIDAVNPIQLNVGHEWKLSKFRYGQFVDKSIENNLEHLAEFFELTELWSMLHL